MTPRTPAAALRAIADELIEAKGLVATAPYEAILRVNRAINAMVESDDVGFGEFIGPFASLREGQESMAHDDEPGPLEAACDAAARLLQGVAARIEGEATDAESA